MTPQQFSRWYRFALRMAHRGWPRLPRKSRKKIAGMVKDFFRGLDEDLLPRIRSWDDTDECAECVANRPEAVRTGNWYKLNTCHCQTLVCDEVTILLEDRNPMPYLDNADYGGYQYRQWEDTWDTRVNCCIRAGLDLAAEPSAGVLGFDVCDLRRMYKGNIPSWINNGKWMKGTEPVSDLNQGNCAIGIWL